LSRSEKLTFLRAYVGDASDRDKWRPLVRRVIDETNRQMLREKSRHSGSESRAGFQITLAQAGTGEKMNHRRVAALS
jgi:hypothetical protein